MPSAQLNTPWLQKMLHTPLVPQQDQLSGTPYKASIAIPNQQKIIEDHYGEIIQGSLSQFCQQRGISSGFKHFGIIIEFEKPIELQIHNNELMLHEPLKHLINATGAVIIKNAYLCEKDRAIGHRNRFPHLNFHIDRSSGQPDHYSAYSRDPFDAEQQYPREASTLFIPNLVAYLQAIKEGNIDPNKPYQQLPTHSIFKNEDPQPLFDKLILQHAWSEPEGTGELSMLDNNTVYHSSYYNDQKKRSYKIGVRYLA